MVDATTTNLGLTLPTVGADSGTWGGIINADWIAIDALWAAIGNVAFGTAATKTVGTATGNLLALSGTNAVAVNVTGNLTGTASAVADGAVTPAKLSTGGPSWDASSNLAVGGTLTATGEMQAFGGDMRVRLAGASRIMDFSVVGNHRFQFNNSTGTLTLIINNVPVWSCDISGNVISKGTNIPSGTPAT